MVEEVIDHNTCPFCEKGTIGTIDSRPSSLQNVLKRRRKKCSTCEKRFTTHEIIVDEKGFGQKRQEHEITRFIDRVNEAAKDVFGDDLRILAQGGGTRR